MVSAGWVLAVLVLLGPRGQGALEDVAAAAERDWRAHDVAAVIGRGPALYLNIPGVDPSLPVSRERAALLLRRYLEPASELGWDVRAVRVVGADRGYVEVIRRYVVTGTRDERREAVFLSYRRTGEGWTLTELRIAR